ncbi:MAG: LemA family protein [Candidatus Marinimicrobia bacterium]|jgi:LemA protein|nr:LemA family protein [Candidatus Neomarinimicrobiota bacterium]MDP6615064.1 LemA family protein [Candidatus Neomarinimicrobiota bacterium]MDP6821537.1 LemA family protein [Candidatus Neomarinimicrobiota bacterium]MDP7273168.1 LemA family protein [Candidatus Neomarinimicrobiota bacterium]MED5316379.1 LemA family protein [Candidatus Neomarinimicrobiota bacterium]|tara:strand:+ start:10926 stop:11519 length:594 start_codon:yes stop_codon:yes gene_type:complete
MNIVFGFIILLGIIGLVSWFFTVYNGLVQVRENIKKSWANIDVLLMQRSDEIPKLIKTVKAFATHEKEMFDSVMAAREKYLGASSVGEKADADNMLSGALKSVFALSEAYPELRSNENFIQFQNRISGLENEIADRREFYNESVNNYNIRIQSLPDVWIAGSMGLQQEEMFEVPVEKKEDVDIDLDNLYGDKGSDQQ